LWHRTDTAEACDAVGGDGPLVAGNGGQQRRGDIIEQLGGFGGRRGCQ